VLVEKPIALDAADAHAVVSAAETHKKILMVGHLMLFHPAVEKLKSMIDGGELGRVFYI
jgi:predicted dehydrogenase